MRLKAGMSRTWFTACLTPLFGRILMKRDLQRFQNQVFDLLVIGGGVSGASIAWDAVLRGFSVALIERKDFGHATSAATSKLIHGGLRYLAQGDIPVVRESLRERRYLEMNMPHQVFPLPFLMGLRPK